jgi:hypothetical protein
MDVWRDAPTSAARAAARDVMITCALDAGLIRVHPRRRPDR